MRLGAVDFPPELIAAIRNRNLVVFAGAGASKRPPADLPLFDELASRIAEGSGVTRREGEQTDQFLGRLATDNHANVNAIAARILTDRDPQPSGLHKDLIRLTQGGTTDFRLVTTNFDLLFEAAAEEILGDIPIAFRSPALPRGDDFDGIVHVHGDVTAIEDMVLTDADFGRAYLTEGWARRFLVALFQTKPVLFVGYSHRDAIMEYLARALPISQDMPDRFILTDVEDAPYWTRLGIRPIMFPEGAFCLQDEAVGKLAAAVDRGTSNWRDLIRSTVISPPRGLSDEDAELLEFGLSNAADALTNLRVFANNAKSFEWVNWMDQRGLLNQLFDEGGYDDKDAQKAWWIASSFVRQESNALLRFIGLKSLRLHPSFWYQIAMHLGLKDETPVASDDLSRWVSILVSKAFDLPQHVLVSIFERCVELGRFDDALDILNVAVRPSIHEVASTGEKDFGEPEVRIGIDQCELARMYAVLSENLPEVAERLVVMTTQHLASQHRQLVSWEQANRDFSQPSIHRETIKREVDSDRSNSEDVLIDMARDSLIWLAENEPTKAQAWIESLTSSDVPLLRRLAPIALVELPE